MQQNFRFLHMKDVVDCKILTIVENFLIIFVILIISPHDICQKLNLPCFVAKSVGQRFMLFYGDLRVFCVEKNCSQKCGEKMTNMMYGQFVTYASQNTSLLASFSGCSRCHSLSLSGQNMPLGPFVMQEKEIDSVPNHFFYCVNFVISFIEVFSLIFTQTA